MISNTVVVALTLALSRLVVLLNVLVYPRAEAFLTYLQERPWEKNKFVPLRPLTPHEGQEDGNAEREVLEDLVPGGQADNPLPQAAYFPSTRSSAHSRHEPSPVTSGLLNTLRSITSFEDGGARLWR